jgi:hypothetical protein
MSMKRKAGTAARLCAAFFMTASATVPAAADFVFFKNGRIIEGEMLITPSVLHFRMTASYLDLSWVAPSFPVKSYIVYLRRGKGEFLFAGETSGTSMRLRGLECGTEYTAHVTSIDSENRESAPSNDIRFVTFSGKPQPPARLRVTALERDGKGFSARVIWDKATDTCGGMVKEYCVYISPPVEAVKAPVKEKKKDPRPAPDGAERFAGFVLAGKTAGPAFQLSGLKENVSYTVMVTSLDGSKNESGSATVAFIAAGRSAPPANLRPGAPYPLECRKMVSRDGKETMAQLFWKEAGDPDGYVAAYRVYRKKKDGYELAGTTSGTDFQVRGIQFSDADYFVVRSVDDRGAESVDSIRVTTGNPLTVTVTSRFAFMVPLRGFNTFFDPGYGWLLGVGVSLRPIMVGAETGFLRFAGRRDKARETSIVPFLATVSGEFVLAPWVSIVPGIAAGGCYNAALVSPARTPLFRVPLYRTRSAVEPMFGGGVSFLFAPMPLLVIHAAIEYRGIIEAGGVTDFFSLSAGAGVRF